MKEYIFIKKKDYKSSFHVVKNTSNIYRSFDIHI